MKMPSRNRAGSIEELEGDRHLSACAGAGAGCPDGPRAHAGARASARMRAGNRFVWLPGSFGAESMQMAGSFATRVAAG